ncbi:unnamed protein product [Prorocentrum cordatum]|uniref:Feruloyl esterase n=1 Tax=Prorocentrum cordatum TaxID=2364126 RepID=A0ABN9VLT0_9DINO|nr:unnamed protein product [Polarella glacialis]
MDWQEEGWDIFDPNAAWRKQKWYGSEGECVEFRAQLISPRGSGAAPSRDCAYPLAVYFAGLDEKPDVVIEQMASDWAKIAPEPFLMVAAYKPWGMWWFIDNATGGSGGYGWVDGEFQDEWQLHTRCLRHRGGFVDHRRVGLFGFSAGAYAVVELLSHGCIALSGVGIAGVHGHGQHDVSDLPPDKAPGAQQKFAAFLGRVRAHSGAPWIEVTHGTTDQISKWSEAKEIISCLAQRQEELGMPAVHVRELEPDQQDCKPSKKKNRDHHNYFQASFYRREFLVALLGGPKPARPIPRKIQEVHYPVVLPRTDATAHGEAAKQCCGKKAAGPTHASRGRRPSADFEWNSETDGEAGGADKWSRKRKWSWFSPTDHAQIVKRFIEMEQKGRVIDASSGKKWEVRHWTDKVDLNDAAKVADLIKEGVLLPTDCAQAPEAMAEAEADQAGMEDVTSTETWEAWPRSLSVEGCAHPAFGPALRGAYALGAENHGRPVYRKADASGAVLYFWDARDGPELQGWWFGSAVGGDAVMAFNGQASEVPPSAGWTCPVGVSLDPSLVVRAPPESYT